MTDDQKKNFFIKLNIIINSYEEFVTKIYNEIKNKINQEDNYYKGYIIEKKDFDVLKENLNYKKYKELNQNDKNNTNKIKEIFDINKFNKISRFKEMEFASPRYILYRIINKSEFIIINEDLWDMLGPVNQDKKIKKDSEIEYKIGQGNQICIKFKKGEYLYLWADNNQINQYSYNFCEKKEEFKHYIDEIKNISRDINSYFYIEKSFLEKTNKKDSNNAPESGYLISNKWLNNWKKITNYEKIKKIMQLNKPDQLEIIQNEIIYHLEKNNYKYSDILSLDIFTFNTKEELDNYLKDDALAIIDGTFKQSFKINNKEEIIIYDISKDKVYINSKQDTVYNIYKNIILSKEKLNLFFLKQLIKIDNFKEELIKDKMSIKNDEPKIYLINNKIIDSFKGIFEYNKIYEIKKNTQNNNFSEIYKTIIQNEEYMKKIRSINFFQQFNFFKNDFSLYNNYKEANISSDIYIKYISDYSIISEETLLFLIDNNLIAKNINNVLEAYYKSEQGKIMLIIIQEKEYLYEFGCFNAEGEFIIEYILKETADNQGIFYNNSVSIINLIKYFSDESHQNLLKNKNELIIGFYAKIQNDKNIININNNEINQNNANNINESSNIEKENENFLIKIISTTTLLNMFEKELNYNINESIKNSIIMKENEQYYLIHNNFITQFKYYCAFGQIGKYLNG